MQYQYGIVAFFDILGFGSLIKNNEKTLGEVATLLSILKTKSNTENVLPTRSDVDGIAFSDSFVRVVMQGDAPDLQILAMSEFCHLENMQRLIIREFGLLVRGAITIGEFFIEDNIVFGPALVRAVGLEKHCAKRIPDTNGMPVILLDHNIDILTKITNKKDVPQTLKEASQFTREGNPVSILNYCKIMSLGLGVGNFDDGKKRTINFLTKQRNVILTAIERFTGNLNVLDKYKWLACYHNREIHKLKSCLHFQPEYNELCEQLVTEDDIPGVNDIEFYFQTWN